MKPRSLVYLLTLSLVSLALAACSGARPQTFIDRDNDARLLGADLVLHETLSFEPDQVSLYIQHGRILGLLSRVKVYQPYCKLELWTRMSEPRRISPDRFTIKKVVRDYFLVRSPRQRFSALHKVSDDWGRSTEIDSSYLYLHSDTQPDVYRLICEQWNDVSDARYLSPEQIKTTLGELLSLELN